MVTTTSPTPASVAAASRAHAPERMSGAHAIVRTLEDLGTDLVFGIPGGAVLPLYDALHTSTKLRHVLTRHEQGAGHAAATGRFDDEQLFYLQARGIPEKDARRLVVRGFFAELIQKIDVPEIREHLFDSIENELERSMN